MASGGGARAAFFSARAAACTTGDSAAEAAPTAARAITNKREIVMIAFCAGVFQSLLVFFGGVAVFLGGAADFGGGASNALSMPSNWARRSSLIGFGGSSTASPRR